MDKVYAECHSALTHCATEKIITLQFQIQPCVTPLKRAYIQELEKQSELKYPPTQILVTIGPIKNYFQRTLSQREVIENVENVDEFAIFIYAIKRIILPQSKKAC
jgi:hypothetical protein